MATFPQPEAFGSTSGAPAHTGLLRDETLVLRQLLGYHDEPASHTVHLKKPIGTLQNSSMKDVLFVGLDIDTFQGYEKLIPDQQIHIGFSILDTRMLEELLQKSSLDRPCDPAIRSYQFTVGTSAYCRRASNRFLFGTSQPIALGDVKPKFESLTADRDVVVVLHGADSDLKIIQQLDIDIEETSLYIIDTNKVAQFSLQLYYRLGLEKLLDTLQIPYAYLHAAGNDARFCLQALLMLAVRDAELQPSGSSLPLLQIFRQVAQAPRPLSTAEIQAPIIEARKQAKVESRGRRKSRRAARTERRKLERLTGETDTVQTADIEPSRSISTETQATTS